MRPRVLTSTRYYTGDSHHLNNVPETQTRCSCWCCGESDWSRNLLSLCHLWSLTLTDWWRSWHSPPLLNFDGELFPDIFPSSLGPRSVSQEGRRRAPQTRGTSRGRAASTAPALETNLVNDQDVIRTIIFDIRGYCHKLCVSRFDRRMSYKIATYFLKITNKVGHINSTGIIVMVTAAI